MKYERWLIVGFLVVLMAFTTSVLLIPGEKYPRPENPEFWPYNTLTTSDSGWFYGVAREIETNNGFIENHPLSHAPTGLALPPAGQAQPLLLVMLYRGTHAIDSDITLMDTSRYWGPLLFALVLIPIFLIGRELAGNWGGCAAAFFVATLGSSIYWSKVGAFDRETIAMLLGAWIIFLVIRMFKAPGWSTLRFGFLAGLVYGIFGLTWGVGSFYLIPVIMGGLFLVMLANFIGRLIHREAGSVGSKILTSIRVHLPLISSVALMLGVITVVMVGLGGFTYAFWISFGQMLLGYVGIGVDGNGISFGRYASEMMAPDSWGEIFDRFYLNDALTKIVLIFVIIALVKICWSRRRGELLVLPWLLVLAVMVWPEKGQIRFARQWWPLIPVLAGVGVAALVSLFRRLSLEHELSDYVRPIQRPVVLALCCTIVATLFIQNAYTVAEGTAPPTEWHGAYGRDEGFMDAFEWIHENEDTENSIFAIEWSYGSLFSGVAERATVTDGAGPTRGELVEREGKMIYIDEGGNPLVNVPPDEVYWVEDGLAKYVGAMDPQNRRPYRPYHIEGRRPDVARLFVTGDENEFAYLMKTYRDNFDCKIDYVIFHVKSHWTRRGWVSNWHSSVLWYTYRGPIQDNLSTIFGQQTIIWEFEDENVVFDRQQLEAYVERDGRQYLTGVVIYDLELDLFWNYNFRVDPDIHRVLWILVRPSWGPQGQLWGYRFEHAQLTSEVRGAPMNIRIGDQEDIPDFLEIVYTSKNGLVKVVKVLHENLP